MRRRPSPPPGPRPAIPRPPPPAAAPCARRRRSSPTASRPSRARAAGPSRRRSGLSTRAGGYRPAGMKWRTRRIDADVIDVRGSGGGGGGRRGGTALPVGGGLGIVGVVLVLAFSCSAAAGALRRPRRLRRERPGADGEPLPAGEDPEQGPASDFRAYVFDDVQRPGSSTFEAGGRPYERAKLVLYCGAVDTGAAARRRRRSARSTARATSGSTSTCRFYDDMARQLGASGRLRLGLRDRARDRPPRPAAARHRATRSTRAAARRTRTTPTSCRCGSSCRPTATPASGRSTVFDAGDLEPGDLEEALSASEAVGDDRLQRQATGARQPGHVHARHRPSSAARGSSAASDSGEPADCDTFSADDI